MVGSDVLLIVTDSFETKKTDGRDRACGMHDGTFRRLGGRRVVIDAKPTHVASRVRK